MGLNPDAFVNAIFRLFFSAIGVLSEAAVPINKGSPDAETDAIFPEVFEAII